MFFIIYSIGTVGGLYERTILRFIAFSSIANFGYVLLGFSLISIDSLVASVYYFIMYTLSMILFFIVLSFLRNQHTLRELQYITEVFSLVNYNMVVGFFGIGALLSLAGIPPFPGFTAKLLILKSLFIKGHYFIFFFVVALSILSAIYYVRFIRMLFFSEKYSYSGPLVAVSSFYVFLFIMLVGILQIYLIFHQLEIYQYLYYLIVKREFIFYYYTL